MSRQIPAVGYLRLEPQPTIVGSRCAACGTTFLLRRTACASCGSAELTQDVDLGATGTVTTATIVYRAMPGVPTPFASGVVELDAGGFVRCTLTGVDDPPAAVGRRATLQTSVVGTDTAGTEAVGFTFQLLGPQSEGASA